MSKFAFAFRLTLGAWLVYNTNTREGEAMTRPGMSWQEKAGRKRAGALLREDGVLRGSVSVRRRVCGKRGCRCARGERHEAMYVVYREKGKTVQLYVPKAWEGRVRHWVKRYGEARRLLEKLSGVYEAKVRRRRD